MSKVMLNHLKSGGNNVNIIQHPKKSEKDKRPSQQSDNNCFHDKTLRAPLIGCVCEALWQWPLITQHEANPTHLQQAGAILDNKNHYSDDIPIHDYLSTQSQCANIQWKMQTIIDLRARLLVLCPLNIKVHCSWARTHSRNVRAHPPGGSGLIVGHGLKQ